MKITNITFKNTGYLWLAGTLTTIILAGFIYYFFILTPQLDYKAQVSSQLQMENSQLAGVEDFSAAHPNPQQYLRSLDQEIVRVDTLLPDRANMGQALAFLETTAEATGTVLARFSTDKSEYNSAGWTETKVAFRVVGSYNDLLAFARLMDSGPRFMAVDEVDFDHRIILNRVELDLPGIQDMVEKYYTGDVGVVVKPIVDRGLLRKQSLMSMNLNIKIITQGKLPDVDTIPGQTGNPTH